MTDPKPRRYPVDTLDDERTYAADVDMHRDPAKLAVRDKDNPDNDSREAERDAALAATSGQNGQT